MYCVRTVTDNLYWVGANDHRTHLFENIHPIPRGVSYNAYLLLDEKSVLFDTVDWSACRQLLENLDLRTNLSGLYRHRRGLGFTRSRLQRRKYNIWIAKLVFHAKESPIRTRDGVLSLVSSHSNNPAKVYSLAVRIPPNPGLPQ